MMIPASADAPLSQQIRVLQIIVFALAMGVIVFAGVAIGQNLGKPHTLAGKFEPLNVAMLAFGGVAFVMGIVLPGIMFRQIQVPTAAQPQFAAHGPEVVRVLGVQMRVQTATIIGCALFEGGAFANLVAYMTTQELLHLFVAGVLLLGVLARFPLQGSTRERVERELLRMKEEEGLGGGRDR
jgi:hypothetical protein